MMYSKDLTMRPNIQQYATFINNLTYEERYWTNVSQISLTWVIFITIALQLFSCSMQDA